MATRRLAFASAVFLAACSQPPKQAVPAAHDAESPPAVPSATPAPEAAPAQPANLFQIAAMARECARQRPGGLTGQSGSRLVLDKHYLIEPTEEGTWRVTFTEESPTSRPYGRSFEIDAAAVHCDGVEVTAPEQPAARSDAEAVLARARECAQAKPFDGKGTCGSELLLDQPTIHHHGNNVWIVSFPETSTKCIPRGQDLVISHDASQCGAAPMD
jgi:hypothetical protein